MEPKYTKQTSTRLWTSWTWSSSSSSLRGHIVLMHPITWPNVEDELARKWGYAVSQTAYVYPLMVKVASHRSRWTFMHLQMEKITFPLNTCLISVRMHWSKFREATKLLQSPPEVFLKRSWRIGDTTSNMSPSSRAEDNDTIQRDLQTPDRGIGWQTALLNVFLSTSRLLN